MHAFARRMSSAVGSGGLGEVKIRDIKGTIQRLPMAGQGLFDRYCRRYLTSNSRRVAPLLHLGFICGGLGYFFEYSHLSMYTEITLFV